MSNTQKGSIQILAIVAILAGVLTLGIGGYTFVNSTTPIVPQGNISHIVESPNITVESPEITVEGPDITVEASEMPTLTTGGQTLGSELLDIIDARLGGLVRIVPELFIGPTTAESTSTLATTTVTSLEVSGNFTVSERAIFKRTIKGGSVLSLTTASTTLTAGQICDNSIISHATSGVNSTMAPLTVTLPATTTLYTDCLLVNGDSIELLYRNASTTYAGESGASSTIAKNTGIELLEPSGGDVVVDPQESIRLIFTRQTDGTTTVEATSLQDAD